MNMMMNKMNINTQPCIINSAYTCLLWNLLCLDLLLCLFVQVFKSNTPSHVVQVDCMCDSRNGRG